MGIEKVDEHVMDQLDENKLAITEVPKTKQELNAFMKRIADGAVGESMNDQFFEASRSMDLRVSASEEKLRNGTSDSDRLMFL